MTEKATLGGSRTPAPCSLTRLEGKDDNRFTTSVMPIDYKLFKSRDILARRCALGFLPLRTACTSASRHELGPCGRRMIRCAVCRPEAVGEGSLFGPKRKATSFPLARHLRHVHTTLWQGCSPCRQKLHKGLLGRSGKGSRCHL